MVASKLDTSSFDLGVYHGSRCPTTVGSGSGGALVGYLLGLRIFRVHLVTSCRSINRQPTQPQTHKKNTKNPPNPTQLYPHTRAKTQKKHQSAALFHPGFLRGISWVLLVTNFCSLLSSPHGSPREPTFPHFFPFPCCGRVFLLIVCLCFLFGSVAQLVEQWPFKPSVGGSSPSTLISPFSFGGGMRKRSLFRRLMCFSCGVESRHELTWCGVYLCRNGSCKGERKLRSR